MRKTIEYNKLTYRPDPDSVLTVRELIEILSACDPDALIMIGTGLDDCTEYVERVIAQKHTVQLATEPEEADNA